MLNKTKQNKKMMGLLFDSIVFGIIASCLRRIQDIWYVHSLASNRRFYYKDSRNRWRCNGLLDSLDDEPTIITKCGNKHWYKNGLLHRDKDLPAFICADSNTQKWFQLGKRHREHDLPAFVQTDCHKWYQHGLLHRDGDKPAIIHFNESQDKCWWKTFLFGECDNVCTQEWYQYGKLHRDFDQPAVMWGNRKVTQLWYQHGLRHRDGQKPAAVFTLDIKGQPRQIIRHYYEYDQYKKTKKIICR